MTGALAEPSLLVPIKRGTGPLSVVLPPAGGGIGPCLGVAAHLARRGPVHGVRASGLMAGERPDAAVPAMVERYWAVLEPLGAPSLLFGWSLGGSLAWELALRYAERGRRPAVVMVDSPAVPEPVEADQRGRLRDVIAGQADDERVRATTDAHITAASNYRARQRYPGPALLVACLRENPDHAKAWRNLAGHLRTAEVDCGHFEVLERPHLAPVLGHLDEFLNTLEEA
ncbi:thioesterase domain-containing protein [Saccharopolyspora sp. NPDC050389]|uniref:thioesterase domain-containing protein n=1 Tax=Saccharopolyspora sp. NPDC050389 TaxID=3155516 RepID=UPI0033E3C304